MAKQAASRAPDSHKLAALQARLRAELGSTVDLDWDSGRLVVLGLLNSEEDRLAGLEILQQAYPGVAIEDVLVVTVTDGRDAELADADPHTLSDPLSAAGPSSSLDDCVSSGEVVYVPPIDPVGPGAAIIGGFEESSLSAVAAARSAPDGEAGDAALASAIRRELLEDSVTTDLEVHVSVESGVATLRGTVEYLFEAEGAEEVAGRVPGVIEVQEQLDVRALEQDDSLARPPVKHGAQP
jgi:hypothetical protein